MNGYYLSLAIAMADIDEGHWESCDNKNCYVEVSPDRRRTWGRASELMTEAEAFVLKNDIDHHEGSMYVVHVRKVDLPISEEELGKQKYFF